MHVIMQTQCLLLSNSGKVRTCMIPIVKSVHNKTRILEEHRVPV